MLRLAVVWWLPEGDENGALEVGVTECATVGDLAMERQETPCRVLELFEYTTTSIPGSEDAINQLSAFMNIQDISSDTIHYVILHIISDILNKMLKNYRWDEERQEIVPRT